MCIFNLWAKRWVTMFWKMKIKVSKRKMKILIFSVVVALFLVEMLIRSTNFVKMPRYTSTENFFKKFKLIDNSKIVYTYNPGAKNGGKLINGQGFNDEEFVLNKKNNSVRIAMLGDSITAGSGVNFEQNFSYLLEDTLNKMVATDSDDLQFEVMNFGVAGYRLEAIVELLRIEVLKYSPDIIVLNYNIYDNHADCVGLNFLFEGDVSNKGQMMDFLKERFKNRNSFRALLRKVIFESRLCILLAHVISDMHVRPRIFKTSLCVHGKELTFEEREAYFYEKLIEIKQMQKRHGFDVLVCVHSALIDKGNMNWSGKVNQIIEKAKLPYFRMRSYYNKEQWSLNQLRQDKLDIIHPNEIGHRLIAGAMLDELIKNDFIQVK